MHITFLCDKKLPVVIMGDFNIPDIDWNTLTGSSLYSNLFCDLVFHLNLSQLVECSTHSHGNILDLIFTNKDDLIDNVIVQSHKAHFISSDHNIVSFDLSLPNHLPINGVPHYVFDYGKCDYEGLNNYILNSDIY